MNQPVLIKTKMWGFPCQLTKENSWQISPIQPEAIWHLTESELRWILSIKNIPQIYLDSEGAISFLARREKPLQGEELET